MCHDFSYESQCEFNEVVGSTSAHTTQQVVPCSRIHNLIYSINMM